jgi:hypothetical protein
VQVKIDRMPWKKDIINSCIDDVDAQTTDCLAGQTDIIMLIKADKKILSGEDSAFGRSIKMI